MPTYPFVCEDCGHTEDMIMPWSVYKDNDGVFPCPICEGNFRRVWAGYSTAPNIKTVTRLEDIWKREGLIDPEDPEYAKRNQERIAMMRKKNKKKLERMLEEGKAVIGKKAAVDGPDADLSPTTREDIENLPDAAHDRHIIDGSGNIRKKK